MNREKSGGASRDRTGIDHETIDLADSKGIKFRNHRIIPPKHNLAQDGSRFASNRASMESGFDIVHFVVK